MNHRNTHFLSRYKHLLSVLSVISVVQLCPNPMCIGLVL